MNDFVLYQINVRQFSPEGTLIGVTKQLSRLKKMGVTTVWLMPIFPIGKERRKGSLGSPYSVSNYRAVHSDLGTLKDLVGLVKKAHALGLQVIMDWVPNHTAWDHPWATTHPQVYARYQGQFTEPLDGEGNPITDWSDVMGLDYQNPETRYLMLEALLFWVKTADIDGFRMDMAGLIPRDFWLEVGPKLQAEKPLLMIAEWEDEPQHFEKNVFQYNYGWRFKDVTKAIAGGKAAPSALESLRKELDERFPASYAQLYFTTNHDENAWHGSDTELYGACLDVITVLTFTWQGIPMIFNGQEGNLNRRMAFFEPDTIDFSQYKRTELYRKLGALRKKYPVLQSRLVSSEAIFVENEHPDSIYVFLREKNEHCAFVLLNFSNSEKKLILRHQRLIGTFQQVLVGGKNIPYNQKPNKRLITPIENTLECSLEPYGYLVIANC